MAANDESAEESYRPFSDAELDDLRECYGFKDAYSPAIPAEKLILVRTTS